MGKTIEKEIIIILGLAILLSAAIMVSDAFLKAYHSREKAVTITVNSYGEANLEFVLLIFSLVIILLALNYFWHDYLLPPEE